jgi:hypothetical protein
MEMAEIESDEEALDMSNGDDELVRILETWCHKLAGMEIVGSLPSDLYVLPEKDTNTEVRDNLEGDGGDQDRAKQGTTKHVKGQWGPVLVEKRPCRRPKDGRTMMEIAQERKRKANLEGATGIKSHNSFALLSSSEILNLASVTGVCLEVDHKTERGSIGEILGCQESRAKEFGTSCVSC